MSRSSITGKILLFVAAAVWGTAFVMQKTASDFLMPFTMNSIRFVIGAIALLPVVLIMYRGKMKKAPTLKYGAVAGVVLAVAANLQQFGIERSTSGKSGFITALYIVIVPLIGLLFHKKPSKNIWFCIIIAIIGFWLMSAEKNDGGIGLGEVMLLLSALGFAVHISVIDAFSERTDALGFSMVQFAVAGVISAVIAAFAEPGNFIGVVGCIPQILYLGIISCCVGYTFQILGQMRCDAPSASLIMSFESVIAAFAGWIIIGKEEMMSGVEIVGAALIFTAVILAGVVPEFIKARRGKIEHKNKKK